MWIVISYDIRDDRRRTKVHKFLKNFGARIQFSVFECDLDEKQWTRLRLGLKKLIRVEEDDSVRFYRLCQTCTAKVERLGGILPPEEGPIFVS